MSDPYFFGYGSLVNRRTHTYPNSHAARVTGWRRAWQKNAALDRCVLSVVPAPEDYVEGLIASVPGSDWAELDERERHYVRHDVSQMVRYPIDKALDVALYATDPQVFLNPTEDDIVLLSYIDVVVQGFLAEFGPVGVDHFFEATQGWEITVLDDRTAPIYPRHQKLVAEETALVDAWISRLWLRVIGP